MHNSFRILLVEDDDALRTSLCEFLAGHGWIVAETAFGNEAIQMAMQQRFDFSILDFHLPGMTGVDVVRAIRAIRPMPAIMMSGQATHQESHLAIQAGVFTFLPKPLDLGRLRQSVDQLIQHHFGGPLGHPRHPFR